MITLLKPSLKPLMEGLYYPAVLGAGFFSVLTRVLLHQEQLLRDVSFWLALVLVLFFSASYMDSHGIPEERYTTPVFCCDLGEISALTFAFASLGFADLVEPREVNLNSCYGALMVVVVIDVVWHYFARRDDPYNWRRWGIAGAALLVGFFLGHIHPLVHWGVTLTLAVVTAGYILSFQRPAPAAA